MNRKLIQSLNLTVLSAALILLGAGCIFSPSKDNGTDGGGGTHQYLEPTTPENVLVNLRTSYEARDSVEYKALYDSSYVGTSQDLSDPPGTVVSTFRYADEVAHIGKLAQVTTISSVGFFIGEPATWQRLSSDDPSHPEWIMIQINTSKIEIYDGQTLYSAQSTTPVTFTFTPKTTGGVTTWKIVRWNEVGSSA